jgi:HAD superfamily hydrolase (TIGR01509 family)
VLVDSERWYFEATRRSLSALGVGLDQGTYLRIMALGGSCWDLAGRAGIADETIVQARAERDALYRRLLVSEDITVPDVVGTLELLRRTHRMAMVTTAYRQDVELIHRDRSILPFFEFVVAYEDYARAKPDPEPYVQALTRFGVTDLSEAIAIEDSSRGLAAAVAAGIDCVVVRNEFTAAQDFSKAWRIVDSVRELPDLLESRIT